MALALTANRIKSGYDFLISSVGADILDANGNTIPGLKVVIPDFLNGKFQLDRTWLTVNNEFDTYFYLIRSK